MAALNRPDWRRSTCGPCNASISMRDESRSNSRTSGSCFRLSTEICLTARGSINKFVSGTSAVSSVLCTLYGHLCYSNTTVALLAMQPRWKNSFTFAEVIVKITCAYFYGPQCTHKLQSVHGGRMRAMSRTCNYSTG